MVAALIAYSALSGAPAYRDAARRALQTIAPLVERHARFAGHAAAAAEALVSGPYEIAIATDDPVDEAAAGDGLAAVAWRLAPPGAVVVVGPPDAPGVPLLAGRPLIDGQPAAYVCRGVVCDRPVTTAADLATTLTPAHPS
jgi:uncharacterized protein YyaL (SSP411 family)